MSYAEEMAERQRKARLQVLAASVKQAGRVPELVAEVRGAEAKVKDARYRLRTTLKEAKQVLSDEEVALLVDGAEEPRVV